PCKDFLDRGGAMAIIEELVHLYMMENPDLDRCLNAIIFNALGSPILVKKKEMIFEKLTLVGPVIKHLDALFPNQKTALTKVSFHGWRPADMISPLQPGQSAFPIP